MTASIQTAGRDCSIPVWIAPHIAIFWTLISFPAVSSSTTGLPRGNCGAGWRSPISPQLYDKDHCVSTNQRLLCSTGSRKDERTGGGRVLSAAPHP